jgi:hypothetical protein
MAAPTLAPAFAALDDCDTALSRLDAGCCEPGRSPQMRALADALGQARVGLDHLGDEPGAADAVLAHLEDAGAQVGRLQVGCCTPKRLPLYTRILKGLTTAQLSVSQAAGRGHLPDDGPDTA